MEFKLILGVDISKEWFHYCLMNTQLEIIQEGEVKNTPAAIFPFLKQLSVVECLEQIFLVMEHTGIYVQHLVRCWMSKAGRLSLVPAMKISQYLAGQLPWVEKTDQLDARRIAEYGIRYTDKLELWKQRDPLLEKLRCLHRQRERFLNALHLLEVPVGESKSFDSVDISQTLTENQQQVIESLKAGLQRIEQQLQLLIEQDLYLKHLFKLVTSVRGIGPVTAREILIATVGFTKFQPDQAKSFSRYSGVIPLKFRSGKSVRKKDRTSKRTHKKIKSLLTLGAHSLIGGGSELDQYYQRKKAEGKPHLSIVNAIRNKLILRVFAVVRNQTMYQKNLNICLDLP